ncbi:serine hydrolase domain-containing protein [Paraglaciecola sp.]|uniref:serine hydrolase domain-containing protein n=1 Tax=Paraglaciecola sp. TaxID=1920173 RepID=UPI0032672EBB
MKKLIVYFLIFIATSAAWGGFRLSALMQGWFLTPWAQQQDITSFAKRLKVEVSNNYKGNAAYALIEQGEIVDKHFVSYGIPVNEQSVFGVASVGKWITAMGVMRLVEQGLLDLDEPVSRYLTRWQLPKSQFDNEQVSLRLLLSHTAGIEDGLGHNGFQPGQPIQPLVEHLTLAADADEGVSARVIVTQKPGEQWQYSGGSYNLIQLIIEEITQQSFNDAMQALVFEPLALQNTYFQVNRNDPLLAEYFGKDGQTQEYPNYTSLAATGLYSNLDDMHKLLLANMHSKSLQKDKENLLSPSSLMQMQKPQAYVSGQAIWGAGVMLFAPTDTGHIVGHGGKSPFLNASVRFDAQSGDGFIMFQTGNEEAFASNMATQWTLWQTGKPDIYLVNSRMPLVIQDFLKGGLVILLMLIVHWIWRKKYFKSKA